MWRGDIRILYRPDPAHQHHLGSVRILSSGRHSRQRVRRVGLEEGDQKG